MQITQTETWELPQITSVHLLERVLHKLGSHYFDEDTKKFFGSKVLDVKPTPDGAVFRESCRGPGKVYVRRLTVFPDGNYDLQDVYTADNTPSNAREARRVFAHAQ